MVTLFTTTGFTGLERSPEAPWTTGAVAIAWFKMKK
jgi:hypothetical protein